MIDCGDACIQFLKPQAFIVRNQEANREVFRITDEGRVILHPDATIDEATRRFLEVLQSILGRMCGKGVVNDADDKDGDG